MKTKQLCKMADRCVSLESEMNENQSVVKPKHWVYKKLWLYH